MDPSEQEWLAELERLIRLGPEHDTYREARRHLRLWLFEQAKVEPDGSVGDAIQAINKTKTRSPAAAALLVRCLAVPQLFPTGTSQREICDCVETNLANLAGFFSIDPKSQTFEKIEKLEAVHGWVCSQLASICSTYIGLESLLAARKSMLAGLNHAIVRSYGEIFRLPEIRGVIEVIFARLAKVREQSTTLVTDVDDAKQAIEDGRAFGKPVHPLHFVGRDCE